MGKRRANGEGSITQLPDGRWQARIDLGYVNGNRVRKAFFGKTRTEAARKLNKALAERERGRPIALPKQTVGQFLQLVQGGDIVIQLPLMLGQGVARKVKTQHFLFGDEGLGR